MGRPAASADVQPAGRIAFDSMFQIAPEPASHVGRRSKSSYRVQESRSTMIACRSPSASGPPSIATSGGIGYGPGSLSSS